MHVKDTNLRDWYFRTSTYRASLVIEALEVAQNAFEYDGEHDKAEALALLITEMKEGK